MGISSLHFISINKLLRIVSEQIILRNKFNFKNVVVVGKVIVINARSVTLTQSRNKL